MSFWFVVVVIEIHSLKVFCGIRYVLHLLQFAVELEVLRFKVPQTKSLQGMAVIYSVLPIILRIPGM